MLSVVFLKRDKIVVVLLGTKVINRKKDAYGHPILVFIDKCARFVMKNQTNGVLFWLGEYLWLLFHKFPNFFEDWFERSRRYI